VTLPERLLWRALGRGDGPRWRRQHPAGRYVLDLCCPEVALAVEFEDEPHGDPGRAAQDAERDAYLAQHGIDTVRITARDVLRDPDEVAGRLMRLAASRQPHRSLLAQRPPPQSGDGLSAAAAQFLPGTRRWPEELVALPPLLTLTAEPWPDFALLDSGHGRKLERYGPYRLVRPELQAMWAPAQADWQADGEFVGASDDEGGGRWRLASSLPPSWEVARRPVRFLAQPTPFRHLAFFPDMAPHWDLIATRTQPGDECLNLFGYTGVASLVLAARGAKVTHVDASRKSVEAGRANQALSELNDAPIRWLVDDAAKFAAREVRRGRRYHGILLDPPKYGRGPGGEVWSLETSLGPLVADCAKLLSAESRWLILTAYAIRLSALALGELLRHHLGQLPGRIDCGEMAIREEARGLRLPTAIFARWLRD